MFDPGVVEAPAETPGRDPEAARRMRAIAEKVKRGEALDAAGLLEGLDMDKDTPFYVLGLAPNAARISVRFFLEGPFIQIVRRIAAHYEDLAVEREYADQPAGISPYRMVQETVSPKASEGKPSPLLGGALMRAVLEGTPYPAALYYGILTRIRVDADDKDKGIHKINYRRAAVIKAYLTRKLRSQTESPIKEVLCMSLNEQSTHPAYLLGRLFAVLEKAQGEALGGAVNATIKDRYFSTACASPASVFPVLLRLAQHHIAKAKDGYDSDCQIQDILDMLQMDRNPIPRHLSLDDQGVFVLGYYHQRAAFNRPKNGQPAETTPIAETH
jgi:CRISPR-associated protein Csd1